MRQKISDQMGSRYQGRPGMGVRREKAGIAAVYAGCGRGWTSWGVCPQTEWLILTKLDVTLCQTGRFVPCFR